MNNNINGKELLGVLKIIEKLHDKLKEFEKELNGVHLVNTRVTDLEESLEALRRETTLLVEWQKDHEAKHSNLELKTKWFFVGTEEDKMIFESEHDEVVEMPKGHVKAIVEKKYTSEIPFGKARLDIHNNRISHRLEGLIRLDNEVKKELGLVSEGVEKKAIEEGEFNGDERLFLDTLKAGGGELEEKEFMSVLGLPDGRYFDVKERLWDRKVIDRVKVKGKTILKLALS